MKYSISIVSHHSGRLIAHLFDDLKRHFPDASEILLTLNCPEDEGFVAHAQGLPVTLIRNVRPLGFGANHNQAFACARGERFVVVNPDVRLNESPWGKLEKAIQQPGVGACAPKVLAPTGLVEDSVRRYPSFRRLFRRAVLKQRSADYEAGSNDGAMAIDWAAGMFMMFDAEAFRAVQGFDTRYFMYMEDADICRRLNALGRQVRWVPSCVVVHDAQRASHRSWQHRRWHVRSAVRFLTGV